MTQTVLIALIVFTGSVIGPLLLALLTGRQRRKEKEQDYKRQDEVARRVEKVAKKAATAAGRVSTVATTLVASNSETNKKLDVIHTLVNSNMTKAMQGELDANIVTLASLKELIELKKAAGKEPTKEALSAIETVEKNIHELKLSMTDRAKQSKKAEQDARI